MFAKIKDIIRIYLMNRKITSCYKKLKKSLVRLENGVTMDISMVTLSDKYQYMIIVEAMTLLAKENRYVLLFPNHDIRVLYLSKFDIYSAPTTTVELMQNLEGKVVLIPPMAKEFIDEALYKVQVDINRNKFLWCI